jgi:carbonic anhydrase
MSADAREADWEKITDDEFMRKIEEETGIAPPWAVQAFTEPARDVRQ